MPAPITAIVSVPINGTKKHRLYAFSDRVSLIKSDTTFQELSLVGPAGAGNNAGCEMTQLTNERWATTLYENRIYFSNPSTPIHVVTDHPHVRRLGFGEVNANRIHPDRNPRAKYLETFFDHLFAANVDYLGRHPNRLLWSDLYNFNIFDSTRSNEADHYDFLESDEAVIGGVTGLGKIDNLLFTYTGTGIYVTQYVGLPRVYRTDPAIPDVGNDFQYGLVQTERIHYFISEKWRNVFAFNGSGVVPIGDPIIDFFLADVSSVTERRQKTWGYVDARENELVWAYVSVDSPTGLYDKEIVFNIRTKKWYTRNCENVTAFHMGGKTGTQIADLTGTLISGLTPATIDGLSLETGVFEKVWGNGSGQILSEAASDELLLEVASPPILETNDLIYGDLSVVKEIESLLIQCNLGDSAGIRVFVSVRQNIDDAITYVEQTQRWTPSLREGRLTLPRTAGRIIRYKFIPATPDLPGELYSDNFAWTNFTEFVYTAKAEK